MADQKVSALSPASSITDDDLVYVVNDPAGTPTSLNATALALKTYVISDGIKQTLTFYQDNVTASQTDVVIDHTGSAQKTVIMPYSGSIMGIGVVSNGDRSAGTLTVEVFKQTGTTNGALTNTKSGLTAVLNGTNVMRSYTVQSKDVDTFSAGDRIGVMITTDGSWSPTTADIIVTVIVEM